MTATPPPAPTAAPPKEPDGRMWSTGRAEFILWAQRYEDARSAEKASVIADVAGSEIWRAMYRAATPVPEQAQPAGVTEDARDYKRASEMLSAYVECVKRYVPSHDLELWHYLPEVEEMAERLSAIDAARAQEGEKP